MKSILRLESLKFTIIKDELKDFIKLFEAGIGAAIDIHP
jgi:hypothetical protein